ncbi:hypothetical protein B0H14DRAFT_2577789 [Mycena olivaceomarginata]|nr:hypothetical protein B0H14DRAFT_2577789 [Mycena olivaceomarginata]
MSPRVYYQRLTKIYYTTDAAIHEPNREGKCSAGKKNAVDALDSSEDSANEEVPEPASAKTHSNRLERSSESGWPKLTSILDRFCLKNWPRIETESVSPPTALTCPIDRALLSSKPSTVYRNEPGSQPTQSRHKQPMNDFLPQPEHHVKKLTRAFCCRTKHEELNQITWAACKIQWTIFNESPAESWEQPVERRQRPFEADLGKTSDEEKTKAKKYNSLYGYLDTPLRRFRGGSEHIPGEQ